MAGGAAASDSTGTPVDGCEGLAIVGGAAAVVRARGAGASATVGAGAFATTGRSTRRAGVICDPSEGLAAGWATLASASGPGPCAASGAEARVIGGAADDATAGSEADAVGDATMPAGVEAALVAVAVSLASTAPGFQPSQTA